MSTVFKGRAPRVTLATAFFLIVSLNTPPTIPSVPEGRPDPPSPEEIYQLEQVAEWVLGQPLTSDFRVFSSQDTVAAIRASPQSFDLFRTYAKDSLRRDLLRELPYGEVIAEVARRHQVDGLLVASIMEAESGFDSSAISPRGALGLMQIMPTTASVEAVENLFEPEVNIELGTRYFVSLLEEFDGDVTLALAGYNAGPGIVKRYGGMPPYRETRNYVDRVLTRYVNLQRDLWQASGERTWLF